MFIHMWVYIVLCIIILHEKNTVVSVAIPTVIRFDL